MQETPPAPYPERTTLNDFNETDLWRIIILYGRNTATYKLALGACLVRFAQADQTTITMPDLAETFFDVYAERLKDGGKPQLLHPHRQTVMENIVTLYTLGKLNRELAIQRVEQEAFHDVVPRFHTIHNASIAPPFYEQTPKGLVLTDGLFKVFTGADNEKLLDELYARWSLLEGAFQKRRENSTLANDIRLIYLEKGYTRTSLSPVIPVIQGYQDGRCFYCGELLSDTGIDVDHVIPRQVIYHDELWNLVLAHSFCNNQKSDMLPERTYIEKLIDRNERLIASMHPIKETMILTLGTTPELRRKTTLKIYNDALIVVPVTWEGTRGYNPATDPFYKSLVRSIYQSRE